MHRRTIVLGGAGVLINVLMILKLTMYELWKTFVLKFVIKKNKKINCNFINV